MYKYSEHGIKNIELFNRLYSDFIEWCKAQASSGTFSTYCDGEPVMFVCGLELSYNMFKNDKSWKRPQQLKEATTVYLPNKAGHYHEKPVPKYIDEIIRRVHNQYDVTYKLVGTNPQRPLYGIRDDLRKLEKWAKRYYADFKLVRYNFQRNNYYAIFEMTDPVAHQLEKAGLLK